MLLRFAHIGAIIDFSLHVLLHFLFGLREWWRDEWLLWKRWLVLNVERRGQ